MLSQLCKPQLHCHLVWIGCSVIKSKNITSCRLSLAFPLQMYCEFAQSKLEMDWKVVNDWIISTSVYVANHCYPVASHSCVLLTRSSIVWRIEIGWYRDVYWCITVHNISKPVLILQINYQCINKLMYISSCINKSS